MTIHLPLLTKRGEVPVPTCRDFVIMIVVSAGADSATIEFTNPPLNEFPEGSMIQALLPPPDR